jgi:hypothetical protein
MLKVAKEYTYASSWLLATPDLTKQTFDATSGIETWPPLSEVGV